MAQPYANCCAILSPNFYRKIDRAFVLPEKTYIFYNCSLKFLITFNIKVYGTLTTLHGALGYKR